MTVPVLVLDDDTADIANIRTAVNAQRTIIDAELPMLSEAETIAGIVQVGLNAITDRAGNLYTASHITALSIVELPGSNQNIDLDATQTARVDYLVTTYSADAANVRAIALHAGVLVMLGEAPGSFRVDPTEL